VTPPEAEKQLQLCKQFEQLTALAKEAGAMLQEMRKSVQQLGTVAESRPCTESQCNLGQVPEEKKGRIMLLYDGEYMFIGGSNQ
jgi:hypothetical protein